MGKIRGTIVVDTDVSDLSLKMTNSWKILFINPEEMRAQKPRISSSFHLFVEKKEERKEGGKKNRRLENRTHSNDP